MLTKEQLEKLLGRPLTTAETDNLSLYLKIATNRLEDLLCMDLCGPDGERTYEVREGYQTVFTDPFTGTPVVKVDGEAAETTDYTIRQFDSLNGSWFNSIVFKRLLPRAAELVTIEASWGFDKLPLDLKLLLAKLFALNSQEQSDGTRAKVKSKKIEDFSVTYGDAVTLDKIKQDNAGVIQKYSLCALGSIRHGRVRRIHG